MLKERQEAQGTQVNRRRFIKAMIGVGFAFSVPIMVPHRSYRAIPAYRRRVTLMDLEGVPVIRRDPELEFVDAWNRGEVRRGTTKG